MSPCRSHTGLRLRVVLLHLRRCHWVEMASLCFKRLDSLHPGKTASSFHECHSWSSHHMSDQDVMMKIVALHRKLPRQLQILPMIAPYRWWMTTTTLQSLWKSLCESEVLMAISLAWWTDCSGRDHSDYLCSLCEPVKSQSRELDDPIVTFFWQRFTIVLLFNLLAYPGVFCKCCNFRSNTTVLLAPPSLVFWYICEHIS